MSILIKGKGMPENCDVCLFSDWSNLHQTAACKLMEYEPCFDDFSRDYQKTRSKICPLVEIPAKHGRLIDENELTQSTDNIVSKIMIFGGQVCYSQSDIDNAPTVIEVEDDL